jgi:hypothetical protein
VTTTFSPVPVGVQVAWLSFSSTKVPLDLTLVDALIHMAVAQGPPACGLSEQPDIECEADCVTIF